MFTVIQIIIAVVVIYLVFSIVVYVIVEWLSGLLQLRGKLLYDAILKLFRDNNFGDQLYKHPQIASLRQKKNKLPSYIPASNIASATIDILGSSVSDSKNTAERLKQTYEDYLKAIDGQAPELKTLLRSLTQRSDSIDSLKDAIETWFNESMDRVTGWYKKKIKLVVVIVAAIISISFNIDTLHIVKVAQADPVFRQKMNNLADKLLADSNINSTVNSLRYTDNDYYDEYVNDSTVNESDSIATDAEAVTGTTDPSDERIRQLQHINSIISESDLPIGWTIVKTHSWLFIILGWAITAFALSAGAPFWFDILKRLVNLRAAGPKPST